MNALAMSEQEELRYLRALVGSPELQDFAKGTLLEAAHQVIRWGAEHDEGKEPQDWLVLVVYLAGKCRAAHNSGDVEKAKHHTISTSAALANWVRAMAGTRDMRPGITDCMSRFPSGADDCFWMVCGIAGQALAAQFAGDRAAAESHAMHAARILRVWHEALSQSLASDQRDSAMRTAPSLRRFSRSDLPALSYVLGSATDARSRGYRSCDVIDAINAWLQRCDLGEIQFRRADLPETSGWLGTGPAAGMPGYGMHEVIGMANDWLDRHGASFGAESNPMSG